MPKTQIASPKIRQPSGHFSQATMIEACGRLVFISGMTAWWNKAMLTRARLLRPSNEVRSVPIGRRWYQNVCTEFA